MALINVTLPSDGETADASDISSPINTIVSEFNGNIDNANIKTGAAIATSKLASDAGITSGMLGADSVIATKIDWASTGADGGIWWEELGRTTLSSAGDTISVTPVAARKYLMIFVTATATGGTISTHLRFNNDSGTNYAERTSSNGAADGTANTQTSISLQISTGSTPRNTIAFVTNITALEKLVDFRSSGPGSAGGANAPDRKEGLAKWANTADQITRVDVVNAGTGDFAIGSEVVVLGHD
jgi:hypothetical protein